MVPLLQSLQMRDPVNVLATLNALASLLECRCPGDKKFDKPVAELAAKQAFYESKGYEVLINRVLVPYGRSPHSQVVAKVADMLALDLVDNATVSAVHTSAHQCTGDSDRQPYENSAGQSRPDRNGGAHPITAAP